MNAKINLVLWAALVACALSVVTAQYRARHLFIDLESMQQQARQLDIDWAQLQLDQSTLGKNARIEWRELMAASTAAVCSGLGMSKAVMGRVLAKHVEKSGAIRRPAGGCRGRHRHG